MEDVNMECQETGSGRRRGSWSGEQSLGMEKKEKGEENDTARQDGSSGRGVRKAKGSYHV